MVDATPTPAVAANIPTSAWIVYRTTTAFATPVDPNRCVVVTALRFIAVSRGTIYRATIADSANNTTFGGGVAPPYGQDAYAVTSGPTSVDFSTPPGTHQLILGSYSTGAGCAAGLAVAAGVRPTGSVTVVPVANRGGAPAAPRAVVLNVTVTEPAGNGYLTVYPCGIDPPLASNVNFVAGQTIPNAVLTKVGTNGTVCIFNSQSAQIIVDINGSLS